MSWFTSIAGKAEALLNQLDEATASKLQEAGVKTTPNKRPTSSETSHSSELSAVNDELSTTQPMVTKAPPTRYQPPFNEPSRSVEGNQSTWGSPWSVPDASPPSARIRSTPVSSTSQVTDDSLMEFLNSSSTTVERNAEIRRNKNQIKLPVSTSEQLRTNQQTITKTTTKNQDNSKLLNSSSHGVSYDHQHSHSLDNQNDVQTEGTITKTEAASSSQHETTPTSPVRFQPSQVGSSQDLPALLPELNDSSTSIIEMENHRLRQEVGALGVELNKIKKKAKEMNKNDSRLRDEVESLRGQLNQSEMSVQRLKSQEDDLRSSLTAKESQLEVLHRQLQEAENNIRTLRGKVEGADAEKDRFLQDVSRSSEAQNQALISVKVQLEQTQLTLKQVQDTNTQLQLEFEERQREWSKEKEELTIALDYQRKELQQNQIRYTDSYNILQANLQSARDEYHSLKTEYDNYKHKASHILQAKDNVIAGLQSSDPNMSNTSINEAAMLDELKIQINELQSQVINSEQIISSLRNELQEVQDSHLTESEYLQQQLRIIEENYEAEKTSHSLTKEEFLNIKKESELLKDTHVREKAELVGQLNDAMDKLKIETAAHSHFELDPNKRDLEGRLKELTESLIEKQTSLELVNANNNSIKLQLERTEAQLTELQKTKQYTAIEMGRSSFSDNIQLRPMASILPVSGSNNASRDSRHMQRFRSTLDSIDQVGLRLGWVLRYPYFRLLALLYILLLHGWVMIVLFTYKPEIH